MHENSQNPTISTYSVWNYRTEHHENHMTLRFWHSTMRRHSICGSSLGHAPRRGCILQSHAFPHHQSSSWQCLTCAHQFQIHETRTTRFPTVVQVPPLVMKCSHDHPFHMFSRNICNAPQIGFDLRIFHLFFIFHVVF